MGSKREVPAPATLPAPEHMSGLGNSHLTITTGSPEAQMWFDQGLNLLHDFWEYEAARAFEQAVRLDPKCAMCQWGLYQALTFRGGWDAYSHQALEAAEQLKRNASPHERLYIDAARLEQAEKHKKSVRTLRKLVAQDPADIQAKIYLALALRDGYTAQHEPKPGTQESIAILEQVLKEHPEDSAAHHYWIHAMEPSSHPERAIDSAQKLASLAPASGHMVHMPGHIFYRTGQYAQAEKWFSDSTAVDEAYMHAQHVAVDDDWNYVHNLMYGIANLLEEGKIAQATTLSSKLSGARGDYAATLYVGVPRDGMTRLNPLLPVALRQGDWARVAEMARASKPDAHLPNLVFLAGQLATFAEGMDAVTRNDLTTADKSAKALDDALVAAKKEPAEPKEKADRNPAGPVTRVVMPDAKLPPLVSSLSIMAKELHASIAVARKDTAHAKQLFDEAAKAEADLGYREPPMYIRPATETEGQALLRSGDAAGAHAAFAAALRERPNSGFSLYGLAQSSEAAGDATAAHEEYSRFLAAWNNADAASPQLAHAQQYMASHTALAQAKP